MTPKYRTTRPVNIAGMHLEGGAIVSLYEWPAAHLHLEPENDAAERVMAWYKRHPAVGSFSPRPYSDLLGKIFLPGAMSGPRIDARTKLHRYPAPHKAVKGMPEYRAKMKVFSGDDTVYAGETLIFLGWLSGTPIDPANQVAYDVVAYLEANPTNSRRLLSPWNEFDDKLTLPNLEPVRSGPPLFEPDHTYKKFTASIVAAHRQ